MRGFHAKYGEAVCFGRDEVSFIKAEAWKDIYGYGDRHLPKIHTSAQDPSAITGANNEDHARMRKAL